MCAIKFTFYVLIIFYNVISTSVLNLNTLAPWKNYSKKKFKIKMTKNLDEKNALLTLKKKYIKQVKGNRKLRIEIAFALNKIDVKTIDNWIALEKYYMLCDKRALNVLAKLNGCFIYDLVDA